MIRQIACSQHVLVPSATGETPAPTDTGAALPSEVPPQDVKTMTITKGGEAATVTLTASSIPQTTVVSVGEGAETLTFGNILTSKYSNCCLFTRY